MTNNIRKRLTGMTSDQPLSENRPRPLAQQQLTAIETDLLTATTAAQQLRVSLDRVYNQLDFLRDRNDVLEQQLHGERQRNAALLDLLDSAKESQEP